MTNVDSDNIPFDIDNMVNSVINGRITGTDCFSSFNPVFKSAIDGTTLEDARKEWLRYVDYRKELALKNARDVYSFYRDPVLLKKSIVEAYQVAAFERRMF
jgi:hypothetical protein